MDKPVEERVKDLKVEIFDIMAEITRLGSIKNRKIVELNRLLFEQRQGRITQEGKA